MTVSRILHMRFFNVERWNYVHCYILYFRRLQANFFEKEKGIAQVKWWFPS